MTNWWWSKEWLAYERACGREGERSRELATATWATRVVDLTQDREALWRGLRRSYHAIINGLLKDDDLNAGEPRPEAFMRDAPALHRQVAGRQTRPLESWQIQADWIGAGYGRAYSALRLDDGADVGATLIGFIYVITADRWAYYMSSATIEPNVNHGLVWMAMLDLKLRGFERFELGWQGHATDEKGKQIEFFRRGFGGADVPAKLERVQ